MRSAVRNVAKYFPTAIISGRSRDKVYELVGLTELHYAGSHGMDIMSPVHDVFDDHFNFSNATDKQVRLGFLYFNEKKVQLYGLQTNLIYSRLMICRIRK